MIDAYTPPTAMMDERSSGGGSVTEEMVGALRGTKGWVLLIGILMFIGAAFSAIGGAFIVFSGVMMATGMKGFPAGMAAGMGIMYLVMAVLYIFLGLYLVKYSSAIGRLIDSREAEDLEAALHQQRKFWRLCGVLASITCVALVLGVVAAILIPMMRMFN